LGWREYRHVNASMGVRRGGQEEALAPPPQKKKYVFALENFALPWKKVCGRPCMQVHMWVQLRVRLQEPQETKIKFDK